MNRSSRSQRLAKRRMGTATVELAVCLPLLALIVFGSIQACDIIYLRHSLTTAAYEGSLEISRPDATQESVSGRVSQVLLLRGVEDGVSDIQAAAPVEQLFIGESATIVVTAPVASNMMIKGFINIPGEVEVRLRCTR